MATDDKRREERLASALRENLHRRKAQARETSARPVEADRLFEEGMALLSVPNEGMRGVALIESAAAQGHAESLERCALFECMGVGRQPDWNKALDRLRDAAMHGSLAAGRQLILIAEDRLVDPSDDLGGADWQAMRNAAPLAQRMKPPPPRTLSANPLVRTLDAVVTEAERAWLIDAASRRLQIAYVTDPSTGTHAEDPRRTNRGAPFPVPEMDCVIEMIRTRLAISIGIPPQCFEVPQVLHYAPGQEFKPHHDYLDPAASGFQAEISRNGQRIATMLVYLNDDYEGGETHFPALGLNHRGRAGDALIFANVDPQGRPHPQTIHAGLPPTTGEKWIFSQWVREHPPGAGGV